MDRCLFMLWVCNLSLPPSPPPSPKVHHMFGADVTAAVKEHYGDAFLAAHFEGEALGSEKRLL